MADRVDSPRVLNIADLRRLAKRRLPRVVFDYIDGGADAEVTLRENCRAFDDVIFRPRCAVAMPTMRPAHDGARHELALPFLLAPVGSSRMFYPRGEVVAARAAGEAGTVYILSTLSGTPRGRGEAGNDGTGLVPALSRRRPRRRAARRSSARKAAGCSALVVTIDTPVAGMRERDFRNGTKELLTRKPLHDAALRPAVPRAPALARRLSRRRRH